jgi:hypothetical protein
MNIGVTNFRNCRLLPAEPTSPRSNIPDFCIKKSTCAHFTRIHCVAKASPLQRAGAHFKPFNSRTSRYNTLMANRNTLGGVIHAYQKYDPAKFPKKNWPAQSASTPAKLPDSARASMP